jgi:hypothetical protein
MNQIANQFDSVTLKKIGINALIIGGAAVATYLLQYLSGLDFGQYQLVVGLSITFLLKVVDNYKQGI